MNWVTQNLDIIKSDVCS